MGYRPEGNGGGQAGPTAIKYGAWIIMLLAILYFLANYVLPLFR